MFACVCLYLVICFVFGYLLLELDYLIGFEVCYLFAVYAVWTLLVLVLLTGYYRIFAFGFSYCATVLLLLVLLLDGLVCLLLGFDLW